MVENLSILNDKRFAAPDSSIIGAAGERQALNYISRNGYRIVCANFKTPVGRNRRGALITGEIDLIACDQATLCFIEVKTRRSDEFASPLAAIDLRKQRQIIRAARMYRKMFHLHQISFRYDAVSVVLPAQGRPKIELFKGFWTESKFRKNFWADDD